MHVYTGDTITHKGLDWYFNKIWISSQERTKCRYQKLLSRMSRSAKSLQDTIKISKIALTEARKCGNWQNVQTISQQLAHCRFHLRKANNKIRKYKKRLRG